MQQLDRMSVAAIAEIVKSQYGGYLTSHAGGYVEFFFNAKVELPGAVVVPLKAGVSEIATNVLHCLNGTADFERVLLRLASPVEYGAKQERHRSVLEQINLILMNEGLKIELDDHGRNPRIVDSQEVDQSQPQLEEMNNPQERAMGDEIFIVHGRDIGAKNTVARFLERIHIKPVVLQENPSQGRTVIQQFEHYAEKVRFAVVLFTPDDVGAPATAPDNIQPRTRQNVIFELGYFIGKLGMARVCVLVKGKPEMLSDYSGVLYTDMDDKGGWQMELIQELKSAGYNVDANDAFVG